MIAKGGSSASKLYLGGTEVGKIYKGDTLVYSSGPAPLPYDAEVEWLGSSGTEYIQIPLSVAVDTYLGLDFKCIISRDSSRTTRTRNYAIFGSSPWEQMTSDWNSYNSTTKRLTFASSVGNDLTSGGLIFPCDNKMTITFSTTGIWGTDENGETIQDKPLSRPLTAAITAFRIFGGYRTSYRYPIKYYSFKITVGNDVVYDLIPVRKDGVGYLYDKIGGGMYGNVGTCSFTYGSDVV